MVDLLLHIIGLVMVIMSFNNVMFHHTIIKSRRNLWFGHVDTSQHLLQHVPYTIYAVPIVPTGTLSIANFILSVPVGTVSMGNCEYTTAAVMTRFVYTFYRVTG